MDAGARARHATILRCSNPRQCPANGCRNRRRQFANLARCFGVALRSRGYQTKDTDMVRPSIKETIKLSSVNSTSATRSSAANAKARMPEFQVFGFVFYFEKLDP